MGDDAVAIRVVVGERVIGAGAIAESGGDSEHEQTDGSGAEGQDDGVGFHGSECYLWVVGLIGCG